MLLPCVKPGRGRLRGAADTGREPYDGDVEIFDFLRSLETERALGVRACDGLPEGKADRPQAVPQNQDSQLLIP